MASFVLASDSILDNCVIDAIIGISENNTISHGIPLVESLIRIILLRVTVSLIKEKTVFSKVFISSFKKEAFLSSIKNVFPCR